MIEQEGKFKPVSEKKEGDLEKEPRRVSGLAASLLIRDVHDRNLMARRRTSPRGDCMDEGHWSEYELEQYQSVGWKSNDDLEAYGRGLERLAEIEKRKPKDVSHDGHCTCGITPDVPLLVIQESPDTFEVRQEQLRSFFSRVRQITGTDDTIPFSRSRTGGEIVERYQDIALVKDGDYYQLVFVPEE